MPKGITGFNTCKSPLTHSLLTKSYTEQKIKILLFWVGRNNNFSLCLYKNGPKNYKISSTKVKVKSVGGWVLILLPFLSEEKDNFKAPFSASPQKKFNKKAVEQHLSIVCVCDFFGVEGDFQHKNEDMMTRKIVFLYIKNAIFDLQRKEALNRWYQGFPVNLTFTANKFHQWQFLGFSSRVTLTGEHSKESTPSPLQFLTYKKLQWNVFNWNSPK